MTNRSFPLRRVLITVSVLGLFSLTVLSPLSPAEKKITKIVKKPVEGVEWLLGKMIGANRLLLDFQADFIQTNILSLFGDRMVKGGRFVFRQPDKLILEYSEPDNNKIIINSNTLWQYIPEIKQAHHYNVKDKSNLAALFIGFGGSIEEIKDQFTIARETILNGKDTYDLVLTPKLDTPAANHVKELRLTIKKDLWLPVRTELTQLNGDKQVFEYSNLKLNQHISAQLFNFIAPKDVEVLDYTPKDN